MRGGVAGTGQTGLSLQAANRNADQTLGLVSGGTGKGGLWTDGAIELVLCGALGFTGSHSEIRDSVCFGRGSGSCRSEWVAVGPFWWL